MAEGPIYRGWDIPQRIGAHLKKSLSHLSLSREARQVEHLRDRVRTLLHDAGMDRPNARSALCEVLATYVLKTYASSDTDVREAPFFRPLVACFSTLIESEQCFALPDYKSDSTGLRRSALWELEDQTQQRINLLSNLNEALYALSTMVSAGVAPILTQHPSLVTSCTLDDTALSFETSLCDSLDDLPEIIETLMHLPFVSECEAHGITANLQSRIEYNIFIASDGVPGNPNPPKKRRLPKQATDVSPSELIERYLGGTAFEHLFNCKVPIVINERTRFEHCHILGGTGHGKTQCLQYLLSHDLDAARHTNCSVVVIDSHSTLIQTILNSAHFDPEAENALAERLIYIDPSDIERPPALNLFDPGLARLEEYTPEQRELAFNALVDIYGRFFGALLGAELTARQGAVFRYLARLMLTIEGATIHTLIDLMDDPAPFARHINALDPTARRFFEEEFTKGGFKATRQQIKTRLYTVLSIPTFDRLFSAPASKLDLFEALNNGSIILIDTNKALLKDEGSAIFGRFMLALIEHAITERGAIPEADRTPTFLYVDEAQAYFDDTVETMLTAVRKYRCAMTLAHQNLAQLSPRLRAIFMGNTTIKLAGGVTEADARALAPDMRTTPDMLLGMRKQEAFSQFALSVRNLTTRALAASIPLGYFEAQPRLGATTRALVLARNRERVGYNSNEVTPENATPQGQPSDTPSHRDLQEEIKREAQARGFHAAIEQPVLDGAGSVDVSLTKGDLRIACEVSATTSPDQEAHNIEKCLKAGYTTIWITAPDEGHLGDLSKGLPTALQSQVSLLSPQALVEELDKLSAITPARHATLYGYSTTVKHVPVAASDAVQRRSRIQAILTDADG